MNDQSILHTPIVILRRLLLTTLCGAAALVIPNLAQADSLRSDVDGDGIHDRIEVGPDARELAVRFSTTRRLQQLESGERIVAVVAADLDRDGDLDLVASTNRPALHVWINIGRGVFAARAHHLGLRRGRLTRHPPRPAVHGVQTVRGDDSVNDSNRSFALWSASTRTRLVRLGETPSLTSLSLAKFAYPIRDPRGPPSRLES